MAERMSIASMTRLCIAATAALVLAACTPNPVRVGSKNAVENRILAEMFAQLLESRRIRVERNIPVGNTARTFEALRSGAIHVYPEYTGTGLVLLGLPPSSDRDQAYKTMASGFQGAGMKPLKRLGFESTYAVVVEKALATRLKLQNVSALAPHAGKLRLAVEEDFARRPTDGLQPFLDFYGLKFRNVEIIKDKDRSKLYDRLIDNRADVIIGYSTDPQIIDYGLSTLIAKKHFFPAYDAVPLVSTKRLQDRPEIAEVLNQLAGKLTAEQMRTLNRQVKVEGRNIRTVARAALVELGLARAGDTQISNITYIAMDPNDAGSEMANSLLRAFRRVSKGRSVNIFPGWNGLASLDAHAARIAMVPSIAQFDIFGDYAVHNRRYETLAALGSYFLQALALDKGPNRLGKARRIATGPVGSASYKVAMAVVDPQQRDKRIVPLADTSIATAIAALKQGKANAVILLAAAGRADIKAALDKEGSLRLIPAHEWWSGARRLSYPFFREATIPADTYPAVRKPVATLTLQATVAGPAPSDDVLGQQGPSAYTERVAPVSDDMVRALNRELGPHPDVGPHLKPSRALIPEFQYRSQILNRHPVHTFLSFGVLAFLVWAFWLFVRKRPGSAGTR